MFGGSSKTSKCKTQVKMVVSRIKILRNKREVQVKHLRRDVAQLLSKKQDANARTRAEHAIREQNMVDAYNLIEGYCNFLESRVQSMSGQKECPPDLKEAVASLIYAGPRCAELPELLEIRSIFSSKYGKQFIATIVELRVGCGVSRMIIEKLSTQPIPTEAKLKFMREVAREHSIRWEPEDLSAGETKHEAQPPPTKKPSVVVQPPITINNKIHQENRTSSPNSPLSAPVGSRNPGYDANSEAESEDSRETESPMAPTPAPAPASKQAPHQQQQFIPFVPSSKSPDPYARYNKGIVNPYAQAPQEQASATQRQPLTTSGSSANVVVDPYAEFQRRFNNNNNKGNSSSPFLDVASAAEAAAESADQAAAAARAAATLAHRHLSRESSMNEEVILVARPVSRKTSPVNLEDRVASYLQNHTNDGESSEWDSPLPREEAQMVNPSKNLFEEQRKLKEARVGKPRVEPGLFRDEGAAAAVAASASPVFQPRVEPGLFRDEGVVAATSASPAIGRPVFDGGDEVNPPRFDEVSRVESFAVHLETMNDNFLSRSEKMYEKEDSGEDSSAWRSTRRQTYGGKPSSKQEDEGFDDDELVARFNQLKFKQEGAGVEATQVSATSVFKSSNANEVERSSWRFSEPPSRSPPRLEQPDASEKKHPDFRRRFHGAGVDYSEQSSLAAGKKANRFGTSVRTKRN